MRRMFWALTVWCAAPIPKGPLMRIPAVAILATATVLTAAPVRAQTYDPSYPVCLQTYGIGGGYIECGYTSLAQCAQSASGIAAQCISNPIFRVTRVPGTALSTASPRVLNILQHAELGSSRGDKKSDSLLNAQGRPSVRFASRRHMDRVRILQFLVA